MTGIALITVTKIGAQVAFLSSISGVSLSESLILTSLGLLLLTSGGGTCLIGLREHALLKGRGGLHRFDAESTALDEYKGRAKIGSFERQMLNVRLSLVVFLQGCLLLTLFAGLVEEYGSNLTMQEWVNSSFSSGRVLLTWQFVLAASFIMGLLVIYCLLDRDLIL